MKHNQLKSPLQIVEGFFILNAATSTAKRCRNVFILIQCPNKMRAAKILLTNSSFNVTYK